jgi:hypothetical protein
MVGRELRLDAKSYEIIGVLPKEIEALYPHVGVLSLIQGVGRARNTQPPFSWT